MPCLGQLLTAPNPSMRVRLLLNSLDTSISRTVLLGTAGKDSQRRGTLLRFTSELIKFRRSCPQLQRDHFPG
jgi:hypothetical protein